MAEAHRLACAATGGQVDQRAGHGRGRRNSHRGSTHHRVVQLAHRQRTHVEVDVAGSDGLAAGGHVILRWGDERHLRRVLALERLFRRLDQAHAQRAGHADRFQLRQRRPVFVDRRLQLRAVVAEIGGVDEHGGDAGGDHRRLQRADAGHVQRIDQVAGGEHRPAVFTLALVGRIEELQHDLGGREGHPVQLEIAGFLHLAGRHRHMGEDGLADVGLPDPHRAHAIGGHARRVDVAGMQCERTGGGGQVAAVARPVDEIGVDADLSVQVVHVVPGPGGRRDDHALAGAGSRPAQAVGLLAIGVRRADHPLQQAIARRPRHACRFRQVLQAEEHALGGAAAHPGGGNAELGCGLADGRVHEGVFLGGYGQEVAWTDAKTRPPFMSEKVNDPDQPIADTRP